MASRLEYLRKEKKKTVRQMTDIRKLIKSQEEILDQFQDKLTDLGKEIIDEERRMGR